MASGSEKLDCDFNLPDVKQNGKSIGKGAYGIVEEVTIRCGTVCAAKWIPEHIQTSLETKKEFQEECKLMTTLRHPNVVLFIGLCNLTGDSPALVMERMMTSLEHLLVGGGDAVVQRKELFPLKLKYSILFDVSNGLSFLHDQPTPVVHRNLSPSVKDRLLTASHKTPTTMHQQHVKTITIDDNGLIKVADFGLTEDMYTSDYYRHNPSETEREEKMPIKWMALESIETNIFNEKTAVWSFRVTCWEVFTSGGIPYAGVPVTALIHELHSGHTQ